MQFMIVLKLNIEICQPNVYISTEFNTRDKSRPTQQEQRVIGFQTNVNYCEPSYSCLNKVCKRTKDV